MKPYEEVVAEVVRIEYEEKTGRLYLVFEVTSEKFKQDVKKTWVDDIEYRLVDKKLIKGSE